MKNSKNILLLSGVLTLLIFAWLIPKSKGEKKTKETQVSTEEKASRVDKDSVRTGNVIAAPEEQLNKEQKKTRTEQGATRKDTLSKRLRIKDIKLSEFSRKVHCELESRILSSSPDEPVSMKPPIDSSSARIDTLKTGN